MPVNRTFDNNNRLNAAMRKHLRDHAELGGRERFKLVIKPLENTQTFDCEFYYLLFVLYCTLPRVLQRFVVVHMYMSTFCCLLVVFCHLGSDVDGLTHYYHVRIVPLHQFFPAAGPVHCPLCRYGGLLLQGRGPESLQDRAEERHQS